VKGVPTSQKVGILCSKEKWRASATLTSATGYYYYQNLARLSPGWKKSKKKLTITCLFLFMQARLKQEIAFTMSVRKKLDNEIQLIGTCNKEKYYFNTFSHDLLIEWSSIPSIKY